MMPHIEASFTRLSSSNEKPYGPMIKNRMDMGEKSSNFLLGMQFFWQNRGARDRRCDSPMAPTGVLHLATIGRLL